MCNTLKNAIGYLRISCHKQYENLSFDVQKREILNKAKREGYEILAWCEDKAVSAYQKSAGKREGLAEAAKHIIEDQAEAIFFYEESRLDRTIESFVKEVYVPLKEKKPNCKFFSTQSANEWDPHNVMVILKFIFANQESKIKSVRAFDHQKQSISKNIRPGGKAPFGFDLVNKELIPNENASVVRFIFHLSSWGYSNEKITTLLNESNAPSPNNKGWHHSTVDSVLNRKENIGHLTWNKRKRKTNYMTGSDLKPVINENLHEPIVSPLVWNMVEQVRKLKTKPKMFDTPFLFKEIIFCSNCKSPLITKDTTPSKSKVKYLIYRCTSCKKSIDANKTNETIMTRFQREWQNVIEDMEKHVLDHLDNYQLTLLSIQEKLHHKKDVVILNSENPDIKDNEQVKFYFTEILEDLEQHIRKNNSLIDQITTWQTTKGYKEFFKRFTNLELNSLNTIPIRVLCLMFFERINLNMDDLKIEINYRLTPFPILEKEIDKTASILDS